jgi:hypothetical protein
MFSVTSASSNELNSARAPTDLGRSGRGPQAAAVSVIVAAVMKFSPLFPESLIRELA